MKSFIRICKILFKITPKELLILLILAIVMGLSNGVSFLVNQKFFNTISNYYENEDIAQIIGLIFFVVIIDFLHHGYYVIKEYINLSIEKRVKIYYCNLTNRKLELLDMEEFDKSKLFDEISFALKGINDNSFMQVIDFLVFIPFFMAAIFSLIVSMASFNVIAMMIIFFSMLPVFLCKIFQGKKFFLISKKLSTKQREIAQLWNLITSKQGNRDFRVIDNKFYIYEKYKRMRKSIDKEEYKHCVKTEFLIGIFNTISPLGMVISIILVGIMTLHGAIDISVFASMITTQNKLREIIELFFDSITNMLNGKMFLTATEKFAEFQIEKHSGRILGEPISEIDFKNVSFKYPNSEKKVIDNISVKIKRGDKIALVGNNGTGKTTFVKLLLGLYKPTEGKIFVNGINVEEIDKESLYTDMMAVFQDFSRLSMTLRENLTLSNISEVNNDVFIEKILREKNYKIGKKQYPEALDTKIGREFSGIEISGGQWQMIAIVRAAMKKTSVIVCDEPTASLDPIKEEKILRRMWQTAKKDNIMVVVSHRIGSASKANRIIVFEGGKIVEDGKHEDLIEAEKQYATMYKRQAKWYEQ